MITVRFSNIFGKGKAYYLATESNKAILSWLLNQIYKDIGFITYIRLSQGDQIKKNKL